MRLRIAGISQGILMRTPGMDRELALGFALSEGFLEHPNQVAEVKYCTSGNPDLQGVVDILLEPGVDLDLTQSLRSGLISSGCGVCGREMIDKILNRTSLPQDSASDTPALNLDPSLFPSMLEQLRERQPLFDQTGGIHAAGLFDAQGTLVFAAEDVGRHNAVDKVLGAAALQGTWPAPPILITTSRGSFDILQKAVLGGVKILGLISAPSALAVRMALKADLTLIGFLRPPKFTVYTARHRLQSDSRSSAIMSRPTHR